MKYRWIYLKVRYCALAVVFLLTFGQFNFAFSDWSPSKRISAPYQGGSGVCLWGGFRHSQVSRDGRFLFVAASQCSSHNAVGQVYEVQSGKLLVEKDLSRFSGRGAWDVQGIYHVSWSPDGRYVALSFGNPVYNYRGKSKSEVAIWDWQGSGTTVQLLKPSSELGDADQVMDAEWSPNSNFLTYTFNSRDDIAKGKTETQLSLSIRDFNSGVDNFTKTITSTSRPVFRDFWTPDGVGVVVESLDGKIALVSPLGKTLGIITIRDGLSGDIYTTSFDHRFTYIHEQERGSLYSWGHTKPIRLSDQTRPFGNSSGLFDSVVWASDNNVAVFSDTFGRSKILEVLDLRSGALRGTQFAVDFHPSNRIWALGTNSLIISGISDSASYERNITAVITYDEKLNGKTLHSCGEGQFVPCYSEFATSPDQIFRTAGKDIILGIDVAGYTIWKNR